MHGRENKKSNDLFYMCSLIEDSNSSVYYDSPNVILDTYENNCITL